MLRKSHTVSPYQKYSERSCYLSLPNRKISFRNHIHCCKIRIAFDLRQAWDLEQFHTSIQIPWQLSQTSPSLRSLSPPFPQCCYVINFLSICLSDLFRPFLRITSIYWRKYVWEAEGGWFRLCILACNWT